MRILDKFFYISVISQLMAPDGTCLKMAPAEVVHPQRRQEELVKEPVS